jgi:hypothetical protein
MAHERVGDLSRLMRPAHVGVMVIDGSDSPAHHRLQRLAGAFRLGELRHRS